MLVVPLIFSALALGVAGMAEVRSLGRVGLKTLGYTVFASWVAVLLGLLLVNTLRPGEGISAPCAPTRPSRPLRGRRDRRPGDPPVSLRRSFESWAG
jgi:DAACS family dicarboxylate/amino acid:cation (Na+ or H+) symporter